MAEARNCANGSIHAAHSWIFDGTEVYCAGRPTGDQVEEWVRGAKKVLADDLPAGHKLWKAWAFDLADSVLALAKLLADVGVAKPSDQLVDALADLYLRGGAYGGEPMAGGSAASILCDKIDPSGSLILVVRDRARRKLM